MVATWVILSLIFPALYALSNVIDKFLLEKRIQNCFSLALVIGWLDLLFALGVLFFIPLKDLTVKLAVLGVLSGVIYGLAYLLYYYAISFEEVSRVVSVYYITPILVMLLARMFLAESLPIWKYAAAFVAVCGAVLIGLKKVELKWRFRKAFWLSLLTCVVWAIVNTLQKYLLGTLSFWNVFVLQSFGLSAILTATLFSSSVRTHLAHAAKNLHLICITEVCNVGAIVIYLAAAARTEISKLNPMGSLQPLYLLIFLLIVSTFAPKILKEEFTRASLTVKIVAILMIVVGTFFVAI